MAAAEWLAWDDVVNGPKAFPSGALRASGMAAFTTSPFRSRSRWADDYYAIAEEVGHKCYMVRRLDGARRDSFVTDNRPLLGLCGWKTEADKVFRQFGPTVYAQGFMNADVSREEKERRIAFAYQRRDELYKRAYLTARDALLAHE